MLADTKTMAVPDFQSIMLPALQAISSRNVSEASEIIGDVIQSFSLSKEEQQELLPSKTQRVIDNRVYWAIVYLAKAGLVARPKRGRYEITERGRAVLDEKPEKIDIKLLNRFDEFKNFKALKGTRSSKTGDNQQVASEVDPLESLENSYDRLSGATQDELLVQVLKLSPAQFEVVVLKLLKKMGYGAEGLESVIRTGKSGDGGIDGEISQDPLGLDMIYVQAKKYREDNAIGRPALQQFVGSLNERKANKGIFITTSSFSSEAREYINKIDVRVVLIDGVRLAELMFDFGAGVQEERVFCVKRVDLDFFETIES